MAKLTKRGFQSEPIFKTSVRNKASTRNSSAIYYTTCSSSNYDFQMAAYSSGLPSKRPNTDRKLNIYRSNEFLLTDVGIDKELEALGSSTVHYECLQQYINYEDLAEVSPMTSEASEDTKTESFDYSSSSQIENVNFFIEKLIQTDYDPEFELWYKNKYENFLNQTRSFMSGENVPEKRSPKQKMWKNTVETLFVQGNYSDLSSFIQTEHTKILHLESAVNKLINKNSPNDEQFNSYHERKRDETNLKENTAPFVQKLGTQRHVIHPCIEQEGTIAPYNEQMKNNVKDDVKGEEHKTHSKRNCDIVKYTSEMSDTDKHGKKTNGKAKNQHSIDQKKNVKISESRARHYKLSCDNTQQSSRYEFHYHKSMKDPQCWVKSWTPSLTFNNGEPVIDHETIYPNYATKVNNLAMKLKEIRSVLLALRNIRSSQTDLLTELSNDIAYPELFRPKDFEPFKDWTLRLNTDINSIPKLSVFKISFEWNKYSLQSPVHKKRESIFSKIPIAHNICKSRLSKSMMMLKKLPCNFNDSKVMNNKLMIKNMSTKRLYFTLPELNLADDSIKMRIQKTTKQLKQIVELIHINLRPHFQPMLNVSDMMSPINIDYTVLTANLHKPNIQLKYERETYMVYQLNFDNLVNISCLHERIQNVDAYKVDQHFLISIIDETTISQVAETIKHSLKCVIKHFMSANNENLSRNVDHVTLAYNTTSGQQSEEENVLNVFNNEDQMKPTNDIKLFKKEIKQGFQYMGNMSSSTTREPPDLKECLSSLLTHTTDDQIIEVCSQQHHQIIFDSKSNDNDQSNNEVLYNNSYENIPSNLEDSKKGKQKKSDGQLQTFASCSFVLMAATVEEGRDVKHVDD
ncbi:hypothetical protein M8J76_007975 [Diaphorina citri]|nr:hypothetical protein M8J76_007975 [Diaphorina citri]